MSYIRRLPSGKWQATVRGPDDRRHTRTDGLKTTVRQWAAEQEALLTRGDSGIRGWVRSEPGTGTPG